MTKKKIQVVDVIEHISIENDGTNNNEAVDDAITTLESIVEEPIIEEQVIETKTEIKQQAFPLVRQTPTVEDKILRIDELIKCPKCDKLVTDKTLKYSRKKTCSGEAKTIKK